MGQPGQDDRHGGSSPLNRFVAVLNDAVLLVLVVLLFPLVILLIGAPIALIVRFIVEIAHRL